jgi:hypothetical protein
MSTREAWPNADLQETDAAVRQRRAAVARAHERDHDDVGLTTLQRSGVRVTP